GGSYNNNINQSSESSLCLARLPSGTCFIQRNTPKAIEGTGLEFEASVNKRFSLAGHHGLIFRSLLFGNVYHNHTQFNENTLTSKFGYSYQNAKNQIFVSPLFEHKGLANETLYNAWGASAEWLNILSPQRALKIETNIKQQEYQKRGLRFQNGIEVSAFITFWNQFNNGWFVFAGADYLQKNSRNKVFSMNQPGVRFGVSKPLFDGIDATLFTSFRERRFAEYNAILRKKRLDYEQNYTLVVNAERFAVMGISPSLTVRYSHINSKVDWLFTHDKTTVSLKFNRKF
ncbi:MAG: surface lipoprotein assembly modifier, partial [Parashewanella sp.]